MEPQQMVEDHLEEDGGRGGSSGGVFSSATGDRRWTWGRGAAAPPGRCSVLLPRPGVDEDAVTVFRGDAAGAFGQSVAQFGTTDDGGILVGAPLQKSGTIFQCRPLTGRCQEVDVAGSPKGVNSSMGLTLAAGDNGALACAPTVPQACGENLHLNGFCVHLDVNLQQLQRIPATQPECPKKSSDVALLIDGSGSINPHEFRTMKTFIAEVMKRFQGTDTQFALTQFSDKIMEHFNFEDLPAVPGPHQAAEECPAAPRLDLHRLSHPESSVQPRPRSLTLVSSTSWCRTETFRPGKGAREDSRKVLIVITDGKKFQDRLNYEDVIPLANSMGVTRYAIGVGDAFRDPDAVGELQAIASAPRDHVFRVDNFDALQGIQNQLQEKIFAIEGTQSALGSSFQLEMAQEGFSALLTPEGPVLGAVGAYDWSGGVFVYGPSGKPTFVNVSRGAGDMSDAYLGYAAESLSLGGSRALALGAPRYGHVGRLLLFLLRRGPTATWELVADAVGQQVGSYFGASLCALAPRGGASAGALLVGAPMFYGDGSGGRVVVCRLPPQSGKLHCPATLRGQPGHPLGRFGASLSPGDVDGDGWHDVAVGAPLEDDHRGAVYVFRGEEGGVAAHYSQRIAGARLGSGPRHFGQALSGGRDLTGDRLPDVAVGAQGQVLLLRSPPLLKVRLAGGFPAPGGPRGRLGVPGGGGGGGGGRGGRPGRWPWPRVCFLVTKKTPDNFGTRLSATLRYQATLDPGRATRRAAFPGGAAGLNGTLRVGVGRHCQTLSIGLTGCPRDTLTPLGLRLGYEATGDPLEVAGGLRPALSQDSETETLGTLPFEKNCGADAVCQDNLRLSCRFVGLDEVVVGMSEAVDVQVTLGNRGEDSYGARVRLLHPEALSYRRARVLQSRRRSPSLHCSSEPAGGGRRSTVCLVNPPVLRPDDEVTFAVTLDVPHGAELGDELEVVANASSDNGVRDGPQERARLPVAYSVLLVLASLPDSTPYANISTRPGTPRSAPVRHRYQVQVLGQRGPPLAVSFLVPVALGGAQLWAGLEAEPPECRPVADHPGVPDFAARLRQRPVVDCSVAACRELRCGVGALEPPRGLAFSMGGALGLDWLLELGLPRVSLQSSARLHFEERRYRNAGGPGRLQPRRCRSMGLPPIYMGRYGPAP
ncbi:LOW QUALITY PROTEIN: integrin alpha-X [Mergus octosetaceus]